MAIHDRAIDDDNGRVALRAQVQPDVTYFHGDLGLGSVHIDLQFDVGVVKRDAHDRSDGPPRAIDYDVIPSLSRSAIVVDQNFVPF
jgi:hypothetical protein